MRSSKSKVLNEQSSNNHFSYEEWTSPIPKHLTPEEREKWEKELEWERQEYERRKADGYYPNQT